MGTVNSYPLGTGGLSEGLARMTGGVRRTHVDPESRLPSPLAGAAAPPQGWQGGEAPAAAAAGQAVSAFTEAAAPLGGTGRATGAPPGGLQHRGSAQGSAASLMSERRLSSVGSGVEGEGEEVAVKYVIMDMSPVHSVDSAACHALREICQEYAVRGAGGARGGGRREVDVGNGCWCVGRLLLRHSWTHAR